VEECFLKATFIIVMPSIGNNSCYRLIVAVWIIHPILPCVSSISQWYCHLSMADWYIHASICQRPRELSGIAHIGNGINNTLGGFPLNAKYACPLWFCLRSDCWIPPTIKFFSIHCCCANFVLHSCSVVTQPLSKCPQLPESCVQNRDHVS
jgi:hypothetical protein